MAFPNQQAREVLSSGFLPSSPAAQELEPSTERAANFYETMETDDETYDSGLSLPSVSEQFKEDIKQNDPGGARRGSNPLAENPPKEPSSLNIGDSLHGKGKLRAPKVHLGDSIKAAPAINPETFAVTPTTHLAGQFRSISFLSQKPTLEGKHQSPLSSSDSPTSDYASGNFPSLAESGYDSLHSITSVEKPEQAVAGLGGAMVEEPPVLIAGPGSGEEMDVDHVVSSRPPKVSIANAASIFNSKASNIDLDDDDPDSKIDTDDVSFLPGKGGTAAATADSETGSTGSTRSRESSSLSPAPLTMSMFPVVVRSESPGAIVPAIAENIEIATDAVSPPTSERRHEGKRSAKGYLESDLGPTTKNPRLSPDSYSKYMLLYL